MEQLIRDIQSVISKTSFDSAPRNKSADLARVLGWTQGQSDIQNVSIDPKLQLTRGYIGTQPAVVFAFDTENEVSVNEPALYAYHASIHWGLSFGREGATLFNSHWLRSNEWFRLPFISWSEFERNIDVFDAFRPEKIRSNDIAKIATRFYQPDRILKSVDDVLVERLDYWRAEALRFSSRVEGVDDNLQTLFAQLFVLRTVED